MTDAWNIETAPAKVVTRTGEYEVEAGANFRDTVVRIARDLSYAKFRVYLNNVEVDADSTPDVIVAGDVIRLEAEDKGASL